MYHVFRGIPRPHLTKSDFALKNRFPHNPQLARGVQDLQEISMSFSPNGLNAKQWNQIYRKTHPQGKAPAGNARQAFWNSSFGRVLKRALGNRPQG
jgi:hypothetical protein